MEVDLFKDAGEQWRPTLHCIFQPHFIGCVQRLHWLGPLDQSHRQPLLVSCYNFAVGNVNLRSKSESSEKNQMHALQYKCRDVAHCLQNMCHVVGGAPIGVGRPADRADEWTSGGSDKHVIWGNALSLRRLGVNESARVHRSAARSKAVLWANNAPSARVSLCVHAEREINAATLGIGHVRRPE